MHVSSLLAAAAAIAPALAQLSGKVGPLTTLAEKGKKTCSVLDHGGKADKSTDLAPALLAAFAACKHGGVVVIPPGEYALQTWVDLEGGTKWALQLDGIIYRTGTASGNMLLIRNTRDFEMFSSTGKGAIQGYGFEQHKMGKRNGARLLRFEKMSDFSVHDFVLVDAPMFHFVMNGVSNGEAYNMAIRGGDWGGLDGLDVIGNNVWVHDIMVTNKDECVTVKSPSKNILIENIYCNWSGGCGIGSLGTHTDISTVTYRNIYTWKSNSMMLIKSNGGGGTLKSAVFENFIGHSNAYSLNIDQAWSSMKTLPGDGVQLSNLVFKNWKGTAANGAQRGPVRIVCADKKPCYDIKVNDFAIGTDAGSVIANQCRSAWGEGFCLRNGTPGAYPLTLTNLTSAPAGYEAPRMQDDLQESFGIDKMIPIPAIPKCFFPNTRPLKNVAGQ